MKRNIAAIALSLCFAILPYVASAYNGEVITFKMHDSKIYPGTVRNVNIYVPKAYDGRTPACLWVSMSGGSFMLDTIDELIAAGDIPTIIGVFVSPGQIRDAEDNVVRYNRSNELDRMDGRYAEFLETEVLPAVSGRKTSDGREIKISDRATDRAIYGNSSGGICAFNVAWQRPDLFSRVYASCGTFVSFRGGDQYPALIRKCEPRPIRVFLQDNDKDTWNPLFGSWFEYNELVLSALQFAGYEVNFSWGEGGHSSKNARAIMPDVMRWLFKGWPELPKKGKSQSKTLSSMLIDGEEWRCIANDIAEGAILHPYSEDRVILQSGMSKEFVGIEGSRTKAKGKISLSDPYTALYPGGTHTAKRIEGSNWVWDYINTPDGKLSYGQQFYFLYADAGQILYDASGYLYVASAVGIQVCDQNGRVRTILSLPGGEVSTIAFADNHLFAVSRGKLYVRRLLRSGTHQGLPKSEKQG
jgi:enterochelin esterase-like enzyme